MYTLHDVVCREHFLLLSLPGDAWHAMRETLEGVFSHESVGQCLEEARRYSIKTGICCPLIDLCSCIINTVSSWNI